mmetsp:Transcript_31676/g.67310  ORF Transcript_31676/g.67310 Transcript_31676/m.67310 type:complete len:308 (+) Transcript_31676:51-974(+)
MRTLTRMRFVACGLVCLTSLSLAASEDATIAEALATDDECAGPGAEDGVQCALNAVQLRGYSEKVQKDTEHVDGEVSRNKDGQVLGTAWKTGESVSAAAPEVTANKSAAMALADMNQTDGWSSGSCAQYGCRPFTRGQSCQCNAECAGYGSCCSDFKARCVKQVTVNADGTLTLYHQTSPYICQLILQTGFKIGSGGWCGKAIYFAISPEATRTKAIAADSHAGCMIEARVDVGRIKRFPCCRYCGAAQDQHVPWTLQQLKWQGYDSIKIDPGDGDEYVIYSKDQVKSMRIIPFRSEWRATPHPEWR